MYPVSAPVVAFRASRCLVKLPPTIRVPLTILRSDTEAPAIGGLNVGSNRWLTRSYLAMARRAIPSTFLKLPPKKSARPSGEATITSTSPSKDSLRGDTAPVSLSNAKKFCLAYVTVRAGFWTWANRPPAYMVRPICA